MLNGKQRALLEDLSSVYRSLSKSKVDHVPPKLMTLDPLPTLNPSQTGDHEQTLGAEESDQRSSSLSTRWTHLEGCQNTPCSPHSVSGSAGLCGAADLLTGPCTTLSARMSLKGLLSFRQSLSHYLRCSHYLECPAHSSLSGRGLVCLFRPALVSTHPMLCVSGSCCWSLGLCVETPLPLQQSCSALCGLKL